LAPSAAAAFTTQGLKRCDMGRVTSAVWLLDEHLIKRLQQCVISRQLLTGLLLLACAYAWQASMDWRVRLVPLRESLPSVPTPGLRIGEVARRTGLPVKTIRFYCDQGLLQPRGRSDAGYRLFDQENVAELTIIRALRAMDVSITELSMILEVRRSGVCNCSVLKDSIASKMTSIDQRISELRAMKDELARVLGSWQYCGGSRLDC